MSSSTSTELSPPNSEFKSTISGIPCIIEVTEYTEYPAETSNPDSDWSYFGEVVFDFIVKDRKGYTAEWLNNKLTQDDTDRILQEYLTQVC